MKISRRNLDLNFNKIPISNFWNANSQTELKMHKIHAYPAKFPSFMISKSLEYAKNEGIKIKSIADIFCGCGTTALEAKRNNIEFWGCDINPIATLIAKVKSEKYNENILEKYFIEIIKRYSSEKVTVPKYYSLNNRINYWFNKDNIKNLYKLLKLIKEIVPRGKYRNFFLCSFSNILKGTSKWLTKSIKPQIDPNKKPQNVKKAFEKQFNFMLRANGEIKDTYKSNSKIIIVNKNFLEIEINGPFIDMLITSPPYVTSYEYADIHQLSTLWLKYTDDYRKLRKGTIGSLYSSNASNKKINSLNKIGKNIYNEMLEVDKIKARAISKYFFDIKKSINKAYSIINNGGLAVFIIGNTRYKNISIDNAKYLTNCLINQNFKDINVFKRKISSKILTPYRDKKGKFSKNSKNRNVYNHEFVVISKK